MLVLNKYIIHYLTDSLNTIFLKSMIDYDLNSLFISKFSIIINNFML